MVQIGELYKLGKHLLYCGDMLEDETLERVMQGEKADMIFIDPPFPGDLGTSCGAGVKKADTDKSIVKPFYKLIGERIKGNLKERFGSFCMTDWRSFGIISNELAKSLTIRQMIVWDTEMLKMGVYFRSTHELLIYCTNDKINEKLYGALHGKIKGRGHVKIDPSMSNVWRFKDRYNSTPNKLHSSQKPIGMIEKALTCYREDPCELVLDFFAGSGSVLMTCEKLGKSCRSVELEPYFCDVIINRWEKETGLSAELVKAF